jgi:hypothetical protein
LADSDTLRASRALSTRVITISGKTFECHNSVPVFVLNFMLRRRYISPVALKSLLNYAWESLFRRFHVALKQYDQPQARRHSLIYDQLVFVLFARLCRHARVVWPAALTNISAIVTTHILHTGHLHLLKGKVKLSAVQLARLTRLCNRALRLLSLPTRLNPVKSALHQQRAQFDLIRGMLQHQPPLPVTRLGHQSLTDVLLRLKKTPQERDWAGLKSKSWPPFKQSKTRLDDEKDPEYGISRAGQSIEFMQAYGYPLKEPDIIAKIMSGWHPDGSPTIQARAITKKLKGRSPQLLSPSTAKKSAGVIAALIESTRTLEEAWSCFLIYEESPVRPSLYVYSAMFKKIIYDEERTRQADSEKRPSHVRKSSWTAGRFEPLPGDGLETVEASEDPAEAIYVPTSVPSLEELFNRMLNDGLEPDGHLLDLLVSRAFTLESGIKFWNSQWNPDILSTTSGDKDSQEASQSNNLRDWNEPPLEKFPPLTERRLTALIILLTRFPDYPIQDLPRLTKSPVMIANWHFRDMHPLVYALLLLTHYKPTYRPAWNAVLRALTQKQMIMKATRSAVYDRQHLPRLLAMILTQEVVQLMNDAGVDIDAQGFMQVCICAQNAAQATLGVRADPDETLELKVWHDEKALQKMYAIRDQSIHEAGFQLWDCPRRLRAMFAKLVGLGTSSKPTDSDIFTSVAPPPHFLTVPNPSELHHYARALGFYGDHEGLLSLVKWMVTAKEEIALNIEGGLNESFKHRTLLVSLRVFLECPQLEFWAARRGLSLSPASEELVALARKEIESVEEWDGWPSDDEVEVYCRE